MRDSNGFEIRRGARKNRRRSKPRRMQKFLLSVLLSIGGLGAAWFGVDAVVANPGTVSGCKVTDGDTIRCGDERIRLLGIDAPEMPGHCRSGRACAPGDPYRSTSSLARAVSSSMNIERITTDRYGRTVAMVSGSQGDLSCWQLAHGAAIYKREWDDGSRVARACPTLIL